MGILNVKEVSPGKFTAKAHFRNQAGTEWTETIDKLDKHFIFRGHQMIDVITWMDKVLVILKRELIKNEKGN